MSPLVLKSGQLLVKSGGLATNVGLCCCSFYTVTVDANQHIRAKAGPVILAGQYVTTSHAGQITDSPGTPPFTSPIALGIFAANGTTAIAAPLNNYRATITGQLYFRNTADDETIDGCAPAAKRPCPAANNNTGTHTILMRVCNHQSCELMPNP